MARADSDGPGIREQARQQTHDGAEAYKAGRYEEALRLFESAYKTFPAPALALNLSRTELKLGDCDESVRYAKLYDALSQSAPTDPSSGPEAWLTQVQTECPEIEIETDPPGATIVVEGHHSTDLGSAAWRGRLLAGRHTVVARRGGIIRHQTFDVVAGKPFRVLISFAVEDEPPPPVPPPPAALPKELPQAREAAPPAAPAPIPTWAPWIPAGVAVAGVILAATEGGLTSQCTAPVGSAAQLYDSEACLANRATTANIGWGVAGAGVVTAGVLWLVQWRKGIAAHEAPQVQVDASEHGIRLSGRF